MHSDVDWSLVPFLRCSWVSGWRRPYLHWSNRIVLVFTRISWTSFWFHNSEWRGFSKWKWRDSETCIFMTTLHSFRCFIDSSRDFWTLWYPTRLRLALNLLQLPHGPHSGAIQMCSGLMRWINWRSFLWPSTVLRSPSSLVNLSAFPPSLITISLKRLLVSA